MGIEPATCCLRNSCSATELHRHFGEFSYEIASYRETADLLFLQMCTNCAQNVSEAPQISIAMTVNPMPGYEGSPMAS